MHDSITYLETQIACLNMTQITSVKSVSNLSDAVKSVEREQVTTETIFMTKHIYLPICEPIL